MKKQTKEANLVQLKLFATNPGRTRDLDNATAMRRVIQALRTELVCSRVRCEYDLVTWLQRELPRRVATAAQGEYADTNQRI